MPETDGAPHTQLGTKMKYPPVREYDENGKPVQDIDFTDHGTPKNTQIPININGERTQQVDH